jgi:hypothetical protein
MFGRSLRTVASVESITPAHSPVFYSNVHDVLHLQKSPIQSGFGKLADAPVFQQPQPIKLMNVRSYKKISSL